MSMFLAPIHFMVYGKNQLQEQLIAEIAKRAAAEGWAEASALDAYCSREDRPLDAIIDVSNIHGWLSKSIADVEHRLAALVTELLFGHPERLAVLEELAYEVGRKQAAPADAGAGELFQYLTTHLVDGMPCYGSRIIKSRVKPRKDRRFFHEEDYQARIQVLCKRRGSGQSHQLECMILPDKAHMKE